MILGLLAFPVIQLHSDCILEGRFVLLLFFRFLEARLAAVFVVDANQVLQMTLQFVTLAYGSLELLLGDHVDDGGGDLEFGVLGGGEWWILI